ncbi:hypothetical protein AZSP09_18880 [Azospira sp. I09]|nr:hypothetical protein AZSP09_18880 [Azospira sp. I09]
MESVLDDLENLARSSTAPASAAPPPRPSAPSQPGTTVERIVQACGLADTLARSVCLHCATRVLAMDSKNRATLYCSALYRDIETEIIDCTAFVVEDSTPSKG